jgi:hypothetical protein
MDLFTIVKAALLIMPLMASLVFFAVAAWKGRRNYGWLVPAGLTCWAFLALFARLLS